MAEQKLGFKEKNNNINLLKGSHLLAKLELVGTWKDEDAVFLVKEEKDVKNLKTMRKINKVLNHKQKDQMYFAFRNAGKFDGDTKKLIYEVVEKCEICKKNSRPNHQWRYRGQWTSTRWSR